MIIHLVQILVLGLIQGAAELLPVSSSAHVIVAEKLMQMDPSSAENAFLLVMLHTGTMFAVIVYFWNAWRKSYFANAQTFRNTLKDVAIATVATLIIGFGLYTLITKSVLRGAEKADIEQLFKNLPLIGTALFLVGLLILVAGVRAPGRREGHDIDLRSAAIVGGVQGLALPFRGFSRSGSTISAGLLLGVGRRRMEEFSFALAVVLTPPLIVYEFYKLTKAHPEIAHLNELVTLALPGVLGMFASFSAGIAALRFLSNWLESGRWKFFGIYCMAFAIVVFALAFLGF